jgi:hypothetical protein
VPFIDGRTLAAPSLRFNVAIRRRIGRRALGREARGGPTVHRWRGRAARAGATRGGGDFKGLGKAQGALGRRAAGLGRRGRRGAGATSRRRVELSQLAPFEREFLQKVE